MTVFESIPLGNIPNSNCSSFLITHFSIPKSRFPILLGSAGDSLYRESGNKFSTKDRDNDAASLSCAQKHTGAWWYGHCHLANLNGQYLQGESTQGINWLKWQNNRISMKKAEMKMRPLVF